LDTVEKKSSGEGGSVIVIVMIFLALLTIFGISATNMSTNELKIANNDKNYKMAFYHAEGGVYAVAKWISQVVDDDTVPSSGDGNNFSYLDKDDNNDDDLEKLYDEAILFNGTYDTSDDLEFEMAGISVGSTVRVDFRKTKPRAVSGETAASLGEGTESVGTRSIASLPYWVVATANTTTNASAAITGKYIKVEGIITGGL